MCVATSWRILHTPAIFIYESYAGAPMLTTISHPNLQSVSSVRCFFKQLTRHCTSYRIALEAGIEAVKRMHASSCDDLSFLSENQADEVDIFVDDEENAQVRYLPCYSGNRAKDEIEEEVDPQNRVDRMANNPKGFYEIRGLKALGFGLAYIERGVKMYENSEISSRDLKRYVRTHRVELRPG